MNYIQLLATSIDYGYSALRQLWFIRKFLRPILIRICRLLDYKLTTKEEHKVCFYYPLFNHIVNAENYLSILGRRLNHKESQRLAIISAMATLYDDLIDEENWAVDDLLKVVNRTLPEAQHTLKTRMIFALDEELKTYWLPTENYINALELAIKWQIVSKKQLQPNLTIEETLNISKNKCGNSSLLWASILDVDWTEQELKVIYQSGYVGQLVNDLFDAYKDIEDGVYTIVRKAESIHKIKAIFLNECRKLDALIFECSAPLHLRIRTVCRMTAIHAFALVALEHLEEMETNYGLPLDWNMPQRNELVTDMALWKNKKRLLRFALRFE